MCGRRGARRRRRNRLLGRAGRRSSALVEQAVEHLLGVVVDAPLGRFAVGLDLVDAALERVGAGVELANRAFQLLLRLADLALDVVAGLDPQLSSSRRSSSPAGAWPWTCSAPLPRASCSSSISSTPMRTRSISSCRRSRATCAASEISGRRGEGSGLSRFGSGAHPRNARGRGGGNPGVRLSTTNSR